MQKIYNFSAVKTLGSHHSKVRQILASIKVRGQMEVVVVVSSSLNGSVKVWWDGDRCFDCVKIHRTPVLEVVNLPQSFRL